VSHKDLVTKLANSLMIEQLDNIGLVPQVVAFDLTEEGDELEALTIGERVLHLQGGRLEVVEALAVQAHEGVSYLGDVALDLGGPVGTLDLKELRKDRFGGIVFKLFHADHSEVSQQAATNLLCLFSLGVETSDEVNSMDPLHAPLESRVPALRSKVVPHNLNSGQISILVYPCHVQIFEVHNQFAVVAEGLQDA
jgi:hypothetical protein